ncbi:YY1-associated factor 2 isoform X3 [Hemicordylus capensis]|uniref:YY1-associated factor 2 isoform X3 n=1 Tax=Hemicordylus capensis TaxID=884348 RepID=UPI0023029E48|nr:YY1-associated factor 2 isoform X3 [Hemicordylus capensis]
MGDKKSPTRPKRQPKPSSDEGYWDCSVCTFRNSAEAFKCMMCDVRKGTSTRKPRPVSQLVAQQVTQQFVPPTQSKKEKKDKVEKEKSEKETASKKNSHKKTRSFIFGEKKYLNLDQDPSRSIRMSNVPAQDPCSRMPQLVKATELFPHSYSMIFKGGPGAMLFCSFPTTVAFSSWAVPPCQ